MQMHYVGGFKNSQVNPRALRGGNYYPFIYND